MKKTITLLSALAVSTMAVNAANVMDYDFNGTADGTTVQADTAQYNYTADAAYSAGAGIAANTLAFNCRSSSTDYIIRDKGTGHENALYFKTIDTDATDFGMYFQKIDMTNGGDNTTQVVRVSWSFDILVYDQNAALDPTGWTVKVRYDNSDVNLNVSDGWYAAAVTAQTFSFAEDTTNETSTDGTWTTITGSYDVAIGTGATLGGIQVSTDGGDYTSSGGVYFDNILVDVSTIPEPSTFAALAGLLALGCVMARRRQM